MAQIWCESAVRFLKMRDFGVNLAQLIHIKVVDLYKFCVKFGVNLNKKTCNLKNFGYNRAFKF